jgi:hypothetical protein
LRVFSPNVQKFNTALGWTVKIYAYTALSRPIKQMDAVLILGMNAKMSEKLSL